jgi:hypothetical protein
MSKLEINSEKNLFPPKSTGILFTTPNMGSSSMLHNGGEQIKPNFNYASPIAILPQPHTPQNSSFVELNDSAYAAMDQQASIYHYANAAKPDSPLIRRKMIPGGGNSMSPPLTVNTSNFLSTY